MTTFKTIIERFGRRRDFAAAVDISLIKASAWWQRDSIPAAYWNRVLAAAHERRVPLTLEEMANAAAQAVQHDNASAQGAADCSSEPSDSEAA